MWSCRLSLWIGSATWSHYGWQAVFQQLHWVYCSVSIEYHFKSLWLVAPLRPKSFLNLKRIIFYSAIKFLTRTVSIVHNRLSIFLSVFFSDSQNSKKAKGSVRDYPQKTSVIFSGVSISYFLDDPLTMY